MSDHKGHPVVEILHRDLERTISDLTRGKKALRRDLEQTVADLTRGRKGEDLHQGLADTVRQAAGTEVVPPDGVPNPPVPARPIRQPDIEFRTPQCPTCEQPLAHEQATWLCVNGHGQATLVPNAVHEIGDLAVHEVWAASAVADTRGDPCPFCSQPMVVIDLRWEETELSALLSSGEPVAGQVRLSTCRLDMLIWSDRGVLAQMAAQTR